jgi:hypothetical protein
MVLETELDLTAAREPVTKMVLSARRLPDITEAQRALWDWIKAHPEDEGMRDGFEQLSLMQDIAEEEQLQWKASSASQETVLAG